MGERKEDEGRGRDQEWERKKWEESGLGGEHEREEGRQWE